jgi:hypothetical protein
MHSQVLRSLTRDQAERAEQLRYLSEWRIRRAMRAGHQRGRLFFQFLKQSIAIVLMQVEHFLELTEQQQRFGCVMPVQLQLGYPDALFLNVPLPFRHVPARPALNAPEGRLYPFGRKSVPKTWRQKRTLRTAP